MTCAISKIGDLVSTDNTFLGSDKILSAKLSPSQYFLLMGVVSAIPNEWRSIIKGEGTYCKLYPCSANSFQVSIKGAMTDVSSISSKIVYEEFRSRKVIPPTAQTKYNQRSLRDSTILHGVCVGEMLVLKAICDALTPAYVIEQFFNRTQSNTNRSIAELNRT